MTCMCSRALPFCGEQHAIVFDEVEQVGHLLEVGGYQCGAIACGVALEVHVVENDDDYMFDAPLR